MNSILKKYLSVMIITIMCVTPMAVNGSNLESIDNASIISNMQMLDDSSEVNSNSIISESALDTKLQTWTLETLLPSASILSLATPNDSGETSATKLYTITGLPSDNAIQNFAIGSTYIYVTQHSGTDTYLSRCTITTEKDDDGAIIVEYKDRMTLKEFGHGESLAMGTYNSKTYLYVGAAYNSEATTNNYYWSKQIARITYSAGTTLYSDNASRIRHLNRANEDGTSIGNVWRSAVAISSSQVVFRTQMESGKVQYSFFPLSVINEAFDEADANSTKVVSFYGNTALQKECTNSFVQSTDNNNLVSPNGSFQGLDLTNAGNIYLVGGQFEDDYSRIAKMSSTGVYKYRWDVKGLGIGNNEIEGVKSRNTYVLFAMNSKNTNYDNAIFSAPVE